MLSGPLCLGYLYVLRVATNVETWKPGNFREFEKLSKSQGNLKEIWIYVGKTWKTQGKWKICDMIAHKNAFHRIFLCWVAQGKNLKCPGNLREDSGNLVSQNCGHSNVATLLLVWWLPSTLWGLWLLSTWTFKISRPKEKIKTKNV